HHARRTDHRRGRGPRVPTDGPRHRRRLRGAAPARDRRRVRHRRLDDPDPVPPARAAVPRAAPRAAGRPHDRLVMEGEGTRVYPRAGMKALIVEDDVKVALFIARVLREEGWVTDQCAHGQDALSQAGAVEYDVVLLDWMLPDLDGLEVCRELRRRGSVVPIIMLTARGEVRQRVLGLAAGADDYMV